uniref:Uncharacterized protein n=1 Tax=Anguilla anguilla TaxID=7936 RepID=A0A0E9PLU8_ANGAN
MLANLHFNLTFIVSFRPRCAGVQSQSGRNCVTVQILM